MARLDPAGTALVYSTFLGGAESDEGYAIVVDGAGSAYITGRTYSSDFPTLASSFDPSYNGPYYNAFVTEVDPTGAALVYSTFLGATSFGNDIALDGAGNAFVTGRTDATDFPVTPGAYDEENDGGREVFVTRFNASGTDLLYSTYLGGSGFSPTGDSATAIALDGAGNAYVTGYTDSPDFHHDGGRVCHDLLWRLPGQLCYKAESQWV